MEHQYGAQRFRILPDGRRIGTVPVGTILYIQDGVRPFRFPERVICREPWEVVAWVPREISHKNCRSGRFEMRRCAGGHLALVRSLRDSRRTQTVADWILLACVDAGLEKF
jgi:hypothetical protein